MRRPRGVPIGVRGGEEEYREVAENIEEGNDDEEEEEEVPKPIRRSDHKVYFFLCTLFCLECRHHYMLTSISINVNGH